MCRCPGPATFVVLSGVFGIPFPTSTTTTAVCFVCRRVAFLLLVADPFFVDCLLKPSLFACRSTGSRCGLLLPIILLHPSICGLGISGVFRAKESAHQPPPLMRATLGELTCLPMSCARAKKSRTSDNCLVFSFFPIV